MEKIFAQTTNHLVWPTCQHGISTLHLPDRLWLRTWTPLHVNDARLLRAHSLRFPYNRFPTMCNLPAVVIKELWDESLHVKQRPQGGTWSSTGDINRNSRPISRTHFCKFQMHRHSTPSNMVYFTSNGLVKNFLAHVASKLLWVMMKDVGSPYFPHLLCNKMCVLLLVSCQNFAKCAYCNRFENTYVLRYHYKWSGNLFKYVIELKFSSSKAANKKILKAKPS